LPWVVAWGGFRSLMIAVGWRLRGIPPKRATSGFLPSRGTVTWKQTPYRFRMASELLTWVFVE
jgi:hypothetical protein